MKTKKWHSRTISPIYITKHALAYRNSLPGRSSNAGNNGRKEEGPIKAGSSSRNGLSNLSRAQDQKSSAFDNRIQYHSTHKVDAFLRHKISLHRLLDL
jgi:hypothetical protein